MEALVWASAQGFTFVQALRMKKLLCFISNYSVHNSFWILLSVFTHGQFHLSELIQSELRFILVLFIRTMNIATWFIYSFTWIAYCIFPTKLSCTSVHTTYMCSSRFLNRLRKQSDSSLFFFPIYRIISDLHHTFQSNPIFNSDWAQSNRLRCLHAVFLIWCSHQILLLLTDCLDACKHTETSPEAWPSWGRMI